eukprot:2210696-Amphidinium_carterae.3
MLRVNIATTFTEVHQWISNFFNNTHTGTDDDNAAIGAVTEDTDNYKEQLMIAFNKWYKGKGKGQRHKGKGKDKGGETGDNNHHDHKGGKDKGKKPVVCYNCGRPGHTSPQCYYNTKDKGKGQSYSHNNKG